EKHSAMPWQLVDIVNMRNIQTFILDTAKFAVLMLLGAVCTVFSIICLPSIGLGVVILSEQAVTWSKTSQWNSVPLAAVLKQSSYIPEVNWPSIQSAVEHLLSWESGLTLIVAAAAAWSFALIMFDRALRKWHPHARIF